MQTEVIKALCTAITMSIISILADIWSNKSISSSNDEQSKDAYTVRYPKYLAVVYYMAIGVGLTGVIVFSIAILHGVETATIQHVILFFAFVVIGFGMSIWSNHWKIFVDVKKEEITIYRLLHKPEKIKIKDIYKARIGKKNEIILYRTEKHKLITIDCLADNSERLFDMLHKTGLINKKEEEKL